MKNKKRFLAMGMLVGLMLSSSVANAYGPSDCNPSITLTQYKGIIVRMHSERK